MTQEVRNWRGKRVPACPEEDKPPNIRCNDGNPKAPMTKSMEVETPTNKLTDNCLFDLDMNNLDDDGLASYFKKVQIDDLIEQYFAMESSKGKEKKKKRKRSCDSWRRSMTSTAHVAVPPRAHEASAPTSNGWSREEEAVDSIGMGAGMQTDARQGVAELLCTSEVGSFSRIPTVELLH